jgi:hypothetical protein
MIFKARFKCQNPGLPAAQAAVRPSEPKAYTTLGKNGKNETRASFPNSRRVS